MNSITQVITVREVKSPVHMTPWDNNYMYQELADVKETKATLNELKDLLVLNFLTRHAYPQFGPFFPLNQSPHYQPSTPPCVAEQTYHSEQYTTTATAAD